MFARREDDIRININSTQEVPNSCYVIGIPLDHETVLIYLSYERLS